MIGSVASLGSSTIDPRSNNDEELVVVFYELLARYTNLTQIRLDATFRAYHWPSTISIVRRAAQLYY